MIHWTRKVKALRPGKSFIASTWHMTRVYRAARRLGIKLTAQSIGKQCPETFTTLVRVRLK